MLWRGSLSGWHGLLMSGVMRHFPKEFISSGSFFIAKTGDRILYAVLGTCVGVALYDKAAGVGGIIHLLLPEPTGATPSGPLAVYASLGLPFFIDALCKEGAAKNRLEAVIGGGALLGPVSQQDINLNVGGRTAEIVADVLQNNEIHVLRSETGGFSGSTLELNTREWQAEVHPLLRGVDSCRQEKIPLPTSEEIDLMAEETKPIPQIALKVIRLLTEGDYTLKELSEELKSDQILGAKSLRLCNSVMMGAKKRIDTIDQAILILGGSNLLKIVVSAAVESFFLQKEGGYSLMRGGLFKHALGVANAAKVISSFTRRSDPDKAYTAGLLHDIGKVVLDQYFMRSCSLFYQHSPVDSDDFVKLERQALNVDHLEVGKRLAVKWQLPENLAEVIEFHHYPEKAEIDKDLVHIVYLADLLSSWFMAGLERERINTESLTGRLEKIGLSGGDLPIIIDLVPWHAIMGV